MTGSPPPQRTRVYATVDGGQTWQLNVDTVFGRLLRRANTSLQNGTLRISNGSDVTLRSNDLGDSFDVFLGEPKTEYDFLAASPSLLFRTNAPLGNDQRIDYEVSRDSGQSYSLLSSFEAPSNWVIIAAKIRDSSEVWAILYHLSQDFRMMPRLIYSVNQGLDWVDVFPFDTTGAHGPYSGFGQSSLYNPYEGLVFGAESGSVYLLHNIYKGGVKLFDLLYTTNYGNTWTGDSTHVGENLIDVELIRNPAGSQLWLVTAGKKVVGYSPDNAKTWYHDSVTFAEDSISHMLWLDSVNGYALGYKDSTITFYKFFADPSRVEHFDNYPVRYFRLPTNVASGGKLKLVAIRPLSGYVSVFDALGRQVWTSAVTAARSETLELDVPRAAGVYFLTYMQGSQRQSVRYVLQ